MSSRILLSPPDVGDRERELLLDAFDSNWIAPLGPHVDAFEKEFAEYLGQGRYACALSSGTAALHLALLLKGVEPGSDVLTSTMTFCATANAITYTGANPVFIDSEWSSWNIDPDLVSTELTQRAKRNRLPSAVVSVDLYGQCADYDQLKQACDQYEVPLIADAAESLGATYMGNRAGNQTDVAIFSFNGNKIITTSGGGMLVSDEQTVSRARYLATQARMPAPHYQHTEVGFNYRMSNLLAAVGRGQFEGLTTKVERRQAIKARYVEALSDHAVTFMPAASFGKPTCWLTVMLLDTELSFTPADVCDALSEANIESRPAWKPMHLQPLYSESEYSGGTVAEQIFERGVCLPSGSSLSSSDQDRVIQILSEVLPRR